MLHEWEAKVGQISVQPAQSLERPLILRLSFLRRLESSPWRLPLQSHVTLKSEVRNEIGTV